MRVKAMVSMIPIGVGVSLSRYVAACERVFEDAGVKVQLHAHGTNLEGEWHDVMRAVRDALEALREMGAPRVSTFLKLSCRFDRDQSSADMVRSVEAKLEGDDG